MIQLQADAEGFSITFHIFMHKKPYGLWQIPRVHIANSNLADTALKHNGCGASSDHEQATRRSAQLQTIAAVRTTYTTVGVCNECALCALHKQGQAT
jgi:hypothetical protein